MMFEMHGFCNFPVPSDHFAPDRSQHCVCLTDFGCSKLQHLYGYVLVCLSVSLRADALVHSALVCGCLASAMEIQVCSSMRCVS